MDESISFNYYGYGNFVPIPTGPATPPQAVLLQFSRGLICLVHGFSPASINVTWVLNGETELLGSNTSDVSRAADGTFMLWSHLLVTWEPGASYTCRVAHVTKTLLLSKSQPGTLITSSASEIQG